jgi:hypothetical protein
MNIRIGSISKILSPSYSSCEKCNTTWKFVKPHYTYYDESHGCFSLCEKCWSELTPKERLEFYKISRVSFWRNKSEEEWNMIVNAVLKGK